MATAALGFLKMYLTLLGSARGPLSPNKQNFADLMAMYQSISSWQFNNRHFIKYKRCKRQLILAEKKL